MKYKAIFDDVDLDDDYAEDSKRLKPWQIHLTVFFALAVVLNLLAVIYVNSCREIYYWSNADYWNAARKIASGAFGNDLWKNVYSSILGGEFNYVPSLLPALFVRLFGESRMVFILCLVNCCLLPSAVLIYMLAAKIGKAPMITSGIVLLTMPVMTYLTLKGFTETGGLVIALLCYYLYISGKDSHSVKTGVFRHIVIGLLLAALMIWNNWYLFFSVSFVTAMLADSILFGKNKYMGIITLGTMIAAVSFLFEGFMFRRLIADYGSGSFNFSFGLNLKLITRYFGLLFILLMAVSSVIMGIKHRERRQVFAWLQILICYLMFTATRTHGQGHLLLYVPALITLLILTVKYIKTERVLIGICVLALAHSVNIFIPRTQPEGIEQIRHTAVIPNFSMLPVKRDSTYDILTLKTRLDGVVPEGQYLGVLAYSDTLNSEMLKNAEPSLNIKQQRVGYIANTIPYFDLPEIDISPLCNANYMLVAYPPQTVRSDQKVLTTTVDSFAAWTDIAMAYEEMYEYETVIDDVHIKLYHRVRDVSRNERAQYVNKLRAAVRENQ